MKKTIQRIVIDISYPATASYYWGTIPENATAINSKGFSITNGPFGFGTAIQLNEKEFQCLEDDDWARSDDKCIRNPAECADGISMSVWERIVYSEDIFRADQATTKRYVFSIGGDKDSPGYAFYHEGSDIVVLVATDKEFWELKVRGQLANDTWTNLGFRWAFPDLSQKDVRQMKGLELFVDLNRVGHKILGQPYVSIGASDPPRMLIGCHSTAKHTDPKYFISGKIDEIAIWSRRLGDDETNFFLGGYDKNVANLTAEEFLALLRGVDLSDVRQQNSAVAALERITNTGEVDDKAAKAAPPGEQSETSFPEMMTSLPENSDRMKTFVEIMDVMTGEEAKKKDLTQQEFKQFNRIINVFSNLLNPDFKDDWKDLQASGIHPGTSKLVVGLHQWELDMMSEIKLEDANTTFSFTRATKYLILQTEKIPASKFHSRTTYKSPNYDDPEWMVLENVWEDASDIIKVPTDLFSDPECMDSPISVLTSMYNSLNVMFPLKVNEDSIRTSNLELDSKVIGFGVAAKTSSGKSCIVEPKKLRLNPVRATLAHRNKMPALRNLLFHNHDTTTTVKKRHCVWWNKDLNQYGGWDTRGCRIVNSTSDSTKCKCAVIGMYGIVSEKTDPKTIPNEDAWLIMLKYIGYAISAILLLLFIGTVFFSSDLWEQFHIIRLNMTVTLLLGSIFICLSDLQPIRIDRHICTAVGTILQYFYTAAACWLMLEGHSCFRAVTAGVIGGKTKTYLPLAWGIPLVPIGFTYVKWLHHLGTDPRCIVSWENEVKMAFLGPVLAFIAVAMIFVLIILCNIETPEYRYDDTVDECGSVCKGYMVFASYFFVTWIFGTLSYLRMEFDQKGFYSAFQLLNSATGVVLFLAEGLGSTKFRMIISGKSTTRRIMIMKAFGASSVGVPDKQAFKSARVAPTSNIDCPASRGKTQQEPCATDHPNSVATPPTERPNWQSRPTSTRDADVRFPETKSAQQLKRPRTLQQPDGNTLFSPVLVEELSQI